MGLQQIPGHYIVSASGGGGGGGGSNCVYSTAVSATATASGQAFFTATQVPVSAYDVGQIVESAYLASWGSRLIWAYPIKINAITGAGTLSDLTITIPDYNYNPSQVSVSVTGSTASSVTSFTSQGSDLLSNKTAPGQYTVPSANMVWTANHLKTSYGYTYLYLTILGWYGDYTSIAPTADMSGAILTGTSLPFPDRPSSETASASLSAIGSEYVGPYGTDASWVSRAEASATATYSNGSSMSASSLETGVVGCSKDVLYSAMDASVNDSAAFVPADFPSTAYRFVNTTADYAYGASGLVG